MYLHIYAWCHKVEDNSTATTTAAAPTSPASQCEECREGENSAVCDVEHFPYTTCRYCRAGACVPGACHASIPSVHVSAVSVLVQAASATSTAPRTTSVLTASAGRCQVSSGLAWCPGVAIVWGLLDVFKSTKKALDAW